MNGAVGEQDRAGERVSVSGTDIFISYSREDRTVARHLAECFEADGFQVWWDNELHSGQAFDEIIESQLRAAKAVVVLWSPRSVTSRWVRAEATMAERLKKFAPVVIEECERPIIFELMHTVDLTDWSGERDAPVWQSFLRDLRRMTGKLAGAAPAPASAKAATGLASKLEARQAARDEAPQRTPPSPETTRYYLRDDPLNALDDEFHCLEISRDGRLEKRFVVSPAGLRVGRTVPADVVLADPSVSRAHCLVELADDRLLVTDLRSTNGTFIDGRRIEGQSLLDVGSVLKVGQVALKHAVRRRSDP